MLMTIAEAAAELRVSPRTVEREIGDGDLQGVSQDFKSLVSTYSTIRALQNQRLGAGLEGWKRQQTAQNLLALAQNLHKKRTGKTTTASG